MPLVVTLNENAQAALRAVMDYALKHGGYAALPAVLEVQQAIAAAAAQKPDTQELNGVGAHG